MSKRYVIIGILAVLAAGGIWFFFGQGKKDAPAFKEIKPVYGHIENSISATGTVQPQNRLEVKPPIGGRIEKIMVEEGQKVRTGDILALMSSTDRATILDAARLQGADNLKNWEDVYKPTPLLAPIDGDVIVKSVQPGQIVGTGDDVVVLSDRLIVQAQVDETDIGKVKLGQDAVISLDAYPGQEVHGKVDHVYYESVITNNVTIYKVDILPDQVPDFFRSGMSANVRIIQVSRDHVLLIPMNALKEGKDASFVFIREPGEKRPTRTEVQAGIRDEVNVEIVAGVKADDVILVKAANYTGKKGGPAKTSPFMPTPGGGRGH
ncbi:MAG: efflux RND transporter periplasmic adaptor subunit [Candidatus Omnitrophica bacterium]|nr:efflux RND transporter periplasmic adaptor subunit [Candidatus Omnitrophota bacterium]